MPQPRCPACDRSLFDDACPSCGWRRRARRELVEDTLAKVREGRARVRAAGGPSCVGAEGHDGRNRPMTAARQAPARVIKGRTTSDGDLWVTCWCETEIVAVPAADVLAGRTASCGRNGCSSEAG